MTSNRKYGTTQDMINYTKKWWLLGCHRRAEKLYSTMGSNDGRPFLISQEQFIKGDEKVLGLVNKRCPFVRFRPSKIKFWEKEFCEEKLRRKTNDYWDIYEACVDEKFIKPHKETGYPTVSSSKAYNIRGPFGWVQGFAKSHDKLWIAFVALMVSIIGSSLITGLVIEKNTPPPAPTINNITTPDVNPTINVYTNARQNQ